MTTKTSQLSSIELTQLLADMNALGGFPIAVLTDQHGLPIAFAAAPNQDPDTQSAVVAMIQRTVTEAGHQLGMAQADEISLFDNQGRRLVCRPFSANGHELMLAILVEDRNQSYRRLTNKAVNAIRRQWQI